jgi:hypothetical protein
MQFPKIRAVIARQLSCPLSSRYPNQRKSVVALMAFLMSLTVITACVALPAFELPAAKRPPAITETPRPTETAAPYVVATVLTAELIGKLKLVDGCVRVISRYDNVSRLLVWPPDFEVTIEKDSVRVIGGKVSGNHTEAFLHDGEMVLFGGGEISELNARPLLKEPPNCPGPYWLVGSIGEPYPAINETVP